GIALELVAVALHEILELGIGVVERPVIRVIAAVERVAADRDELLALPAVAADQRHLDAELASLPRDEAGLGVIAGHHDRLGTLGFDGGELGAEILIARAV